MFDLVHASLNEIRATDRFQVIALHGLGQTEQDALNMFGAAIPEYVSLRALRAPFSFREKPSGFAWYTLVARNGQLPLPDLRQEGASRAAVLNFLERTVSDGPVILAGFGQGAVLAAHAFLQRPDLISALIIVSGRILPSVLDAHPLAERHCGKPTLWIHGAADPILPYAEAEALWNTLRDTGVSVDWHPHAEGHDIPPPQKSAICKFITTQMV